MPKYKWISQVATLKWHYIKFEGKVDFHAYCTSEAIFINIQGLPRNE